MNHRPVCIETVVGPLHHSSVDGADNNIIVYFTKHSPNNVIISLYCRLRSKLTMQRIYTMKDSKPYYHICLKTKMNRMEKKLEKIITIIILLLFRIT